MDLGENPCTWSYTMTGQQKETIKAARKKADAAFGLMERAWAAHELCRVVMQEEEA
jgi:hypothetical protein